MDDDSNTSYDRPFLASRLKVRRAADHADELKRQIDAYVGRQPVVITIRQHADPRYWAWEMHCVEAVPAYFSAIIGDAIHNLRTSLDLLAVELVRLNKGDEADVYFPFAARETELENMIKRRHIDRAAPEVVDLIRSLKPYVGGNAVLRYIHDLDIADKHQMILPTVSNTTYQGNGFGIQTNHVSVRRLGSGSVIRNEHMDQLFFSGTQPVDFKLSFHFDGPLTGQESAEGLHRLVEQFSGLIDSFELLCFGTISK